MSNLAQWSALVGFVLPILVSVVVQSKWSRAVRTVIGVAASLAASVVTALVESNLSGQTWATSSIWVLTTAMVSYRNIWVPIGAAPWVEKKTNVT